MEITHTPVLVAEAVHFLNCRANGIYLDATGSGGHALKILEDNPEIKTLIALDCDEEAIMQARKRLKSFSHKTHILQENFSNIKSVLQKLGIEKVHGILLDLGISSSQLDDPSRGFSFKTQGPLDMRMDKRLAITAFDIVNTFSPTHLQQILTTYGEERWAPRIVRFIQRERERTPITDTQQLSYLISSAIPRSYHPTKIHPATKTFLALRIAVNNELSHLAAVIKEGVEVLAPQGRLCIISFHSLEDRIVKQHFRTLSQKQDFSPKGMPLGETRSALLKIITKKPVVPHPEEIAHNPRARSAKLRVAERL